MYQVFFSCTTDTENNLFKAFSEQRLTPYIKKAHGNTKLAMFYYQWNSYLSQDLYFSIQTLEITLRNTITNAIIRKYGEHWFSNPKFLSVLDKFGKETLSSAIEELNKRHKTLSSGAIIAELTFGFWKAMLNARYDVPLWNKELENTFLNKAPDTHKKNIAEMVDRVRLLRNRISHHEPIIHLNLFARYTEISFLINIINTHVRWWHDTNSRFNQTYKDFETLSAYY